MKISEAYQAVKSGYNLALMQLGEPNKIVGHFEKHKNFYCCSICKKSCWSKSFEYLLKTFNYCPNCGAKIEKEKEK